ncbi:MAG: 50S ribosomal protein L5 [Candidatus Moraniibacteriota bacterium]
MMSIKEKYNKEVVAEIKKQFGFTNDFQVPKIDKVVVNVGIGKFIKDSALVKDVFNSLKAITGQLPVMTKSKKSIAGFKTREGLEIGIKITLRGKRKWQFLDKLVGAAIPRVRDFHGLKVSAVDQKGNLNIGIKEHLIFPEISPEQVKTTFGLQVNVTTNANSHAEGLALFRALGFPIEKKEAK